MVHTLCDSCCKISISLKKLSIFPEIWKKKNDPISCAICSMSILERFVQIFERYLQLLRGWAFQNQPSVKCDGADHNELSSKLPICQIFIFFSIYLKHRMMISLHSYLFSCPGSSIPTFGYHLRLLGQTAVWFSGGVKCPFIHRGWCCLGVWLFSIGDGECQGGERHTIF